MIVIVTIVRSFAPHVVGFTIVGWHCSINSLNLMSKLGIQRFAAVLSEMQTARQELLRLGTAGGTGNPVDKQDILLGQLLETAKDSVKERFMEITMGKL